MHRTLSRTAVALCFGVALTGCSSFLDADKAVSDPNLPTNPSRDQLYVGAQSGIFAQQEGQLAMIACQWMQQCAGIAGRFVAQQDVYSINALTLDVQFSEIYSAGGLNSLRRVQAGAEAAGDEVYLGKAQVLEALLIGTATDIWGDIPYSEALTDPTPVFDNQMEIYTALQTLLDKAIANIQGAGAGPQGTGVDLFYAGDDDAWVEAAYTLKARYHMHTAEVLGPPAYQAARAAALLGISSPSHDMRSLHSTVTSERNLWQQFQITSGFGGDLVAGKRLVDLMIAQSDPRLGEYFGRNANNTYGGFDVSTGTTPAAQISGLDGTRLTDDFRQPIVTWYENQLILAETSFRITGAAAAQPFLDAVKDENGKAHVPATLQSIIEEKYISLFQNLEVWNDWKRTCLPVLTPAAGRTAIPGRFYYGDTEEQTNPNTPPSSEQNILTVRNRNDPTGC